MQREPQHRYRARRALLRAAAWWALALAPVAGARADVRDVEWTPSPVGVHLLAPADGATLSAGELAELAWEPAAPLAASPEITEWEAFLSFDGGATYPVRLTPHLDRELRRVSFRVPAVPTRDARILLRLGDERREAPVTLPQRFAIAFPAGAAVPDPAGAVLSTAAVSALGPGEPALPGAAGVVAWVDGPRGGGSTREVAAAAPAGLAPGLALPEDAPLAALDTSARPSTQAPAAARGAGPRAPIARPDPLLPARRPPAATLDILLLVQRLNE